MLLKTAQHIFTGSLLTVFGVLFTVSVFVIAPELESRLMPVVEDIEIELVAENKDVGMQEFHITANKVRSCDVRSITILAGDSKDGILRRVHYSLKNKATDRAQGRQAYDGTIFGEVGNYIRIDTIHECHGLWYTISTPWAEWERP